MMEQFAYKILWLLCEQSDPLHIEAGKRGEFGRIKLPVLLKNSQAKLLSMNGDEIPIKNARSVIDWLITGRGVGNKPFSPATIHNYLEYIHTFSRALPDRLWLEYLDSAEKNVLLTLVGMTIKDSKNFLSALRSFYSSFKKVEKDSDFPPAISKDHHFRVNRPKKLLAPDDLINLASQLKETINKELGEVDVELLSDLLCVFIYLSVFLALRNIEVLEIREIEVSGSMITATLYSKGQKVIVKESFEGGAISVILLEAITRLQTKEFMRDPNGLFFQPLEKLLNNDQAGPISHGEIYRRIIFLMKDNGHDNGTHCFRRMWANMARAAGLTPLEIIHFLGHAVAKNAFENYIQIIPKLQEERLMLWSTEQRNINLPSKIELFELAEIQGITGAGLRKQMRRVFDNSRNHIQSFSIEEANFLLRRLILEVQPTD